MDCDIFLVGLNHRTASVDVRERFALLHDKNGDTYAQDNSTGEVARTNGRQFKDRVTAAFFQQHGLAVREQAWRESLTTVQALARYEGALAAVHIRVAGGDGCYWVDLCQPGNSRAVEIDAQGWRIVQRAPVVFVRSESMQPMPDPVHGGSIDTLWSIANVPQPMRPLVLAWLLLMSWARLLSACFRSYLTSTSERQ